ncbi:hypothetical protein BCR43DRAFT_492682 [Syncephalastrum racemosum]|uniref:Uncharacterized protein n=1 Tax=Syncephalastrum racemosum TaxID=13706 RepID=A0A1X2H9A6_SYNRA|nr:hypothetical protein BCR43DRAFT_492682 [Syncephalastrum racemosum]
MPFSYVPKVCRGEILDLRRGRLPLYTQRRIQSYLGLRSPERHKASWVYFFNRALIFEQRHHPFGLRYTYFSFECKPATELLPDGLRFLPAGADFTLQTSPFAILLFFGPPLFLAQCRTTFPASDNFLLSVRVGVRPDTSPVHWLWQILKVPVDLVVPPQLVVNRQSSGLVQWGLKVGFAVFCWGPLEHPLRFLHNIVLDLRVRLVSQHLHPLDIDNVGSFRGLLRGILGDEGLESNVSFCTYVCRGGAPFIKQAC